MENLVLLNRPNDTVSKRRVSRKRKCRYELDLTQKFQHLLLSVLFNFLVYTRYCCVVISVQLSNYPKNTAIEFANLHCKHLGLTQDTYRTFNQSACTCFFLFSFLGLCKEISQHLCHEHVAACNMEKILDTDATTWYFGINVT